MIKLTKLISSHAGRPKKGAEATREKMSTRTVKLPDTHWAAFDETCKALGLTEHEAIRIAVLQLVYPENKNPEFYS
jgi:hypothetical protein